MVLVAAAVAQSAVLSADCRLVVGLSIRAISLPPPVLVGFCALRRLLSRGLFETLAGAVFQRPDRGAAAVCQRPGRGDAAGLCRLALRPMVKSVQEFLLNMQIQTDSLIR